MSLDSLWFQNGQPSKLGERKQSPSKQGHLKIWTEHSTLIFGNLKLIEI